MKPQAEFARRTIEATVRIVDLGLLHSASLLVPGGQRAEWRREWQGELWQVRHACSCADQFRWRAEREIAGFCLGAFQDAYCLREIGRRAGTPPAISFGSAWQCILFLSVILGVSYGMARMLPGVRAERSMSQYLVRPGLVLIENAEEETTTRTISSVQYRAWADRKQEFFDGLAFYRVTQEPVGRETAQAGSRETGGWGVARASSNFFALLGIPVRFRETVASADVDLPRVVLSENLWKREFGADPHVAGGIVRVGLRRATIAGVAPDGPWGLPGNVDAWLLEPDSHMVPAGAGYVVAHLTNSGKSKMDSARVPIKSYSPHRTPDDLLGIALGTGMPGEWEIFRFAAFLAFLALPAITSVSVGDLTVSVHRISWARRLFRWGFLGAKIALLLLIVHFSSLDLAYGFTGFDTSQAVYIQLVSTFFICMFGMRWVLSDQRQRCPVCLRRVDHPARVGQLSRTFLAWNGTELMCMGGHTLLHVPSLPTSWFSSQRWMLLDPSWEFLFAGVERE
jgi:hypothetical protein